MKPTLFVGSSSESLPLAEAVQTSLRHVADVTLWNQGVFRLSETALDSLLARSRFHDYTVFVLGTDDLILMRDSLYNVARDNVIFELGLFTSTLGPKRCFFMVPTGGTDFHVPLDLAGITFAPYDITSHDGNLQEIMGASCSEIVSTIRTRHALSGEWLLFIEESQHDEPNGKMHITCAGDRAAARLFLIKDTDGKSADRIFRYEGRYTSGQFVLNFEQKGAEDQIVGCMVLRASADRKLITGITAFWHHDKASMVTTAFKLKRDHKDAVNK